MLVDNQYSLVKKQYTFCHINFCVFNMCVYVNPVIQYIIVNKTT